MSRRPPLAGVATFVAMAALAGCAGAAGSNGPADDAGTVAPRGTTLAAASELRLELGQTIAVDDGALEITFSEVISDSRCPKGETCFWEGDAVIRLAARSGADAGAIELHTASRGPHADVFAGWSIELLALDPTPVAGKPAPLAYVATLRVGRGDAADNAIQ